MSGWVSTWHMSLLRAAGMERTPYAKTALIKWQKSTPTEPWTHNPLGIPSKGYSNQAVPGTPYALFNKWADFNDAFVKAVARPEAADIRSYLSSGESPAKLWRAINSLGWPAATTEDNWPRELYTAIGDPFRAKLNLPERQTNRSSGTHDGTATDSHAVLQHQRAMITAVQTKQDLASAIAFIIKGVR